MAKRLPRGLQDPSGGHFGAILEPFWSHFGRHKQPFGKPRGPARSTPKDIQEHFKNSKTSLLCQEFSKIFQDKPPRASFSERKPRSLHDCMLPCARAGFKGWAAVPRRRRLGLNILFHRIPMNVYRTHLDSNRIHSISYKLL